MTETIDEKARVYAAEIIEIATNPNDSYPLDAVRDAVEASFLVGANEALESQWVNIKNALPSERETVIGAVFSEDGDLYQLWCVIFKGRKIDGLHFETVVDGERRPVTHWMRIPPVKGGER